MLVLDHYLETLTHKPGALSGATALASARATGRFTSAHDEFWTGARRHLGDSAGTRVLVDVLLLERTMSASLVVEGMRRARQVHSYDAAIVAIEGRRSLDEALRPTVVPDSLSHFDRALPSIAHYDSLTGVQ